jgi:phosphatidylglycerol:prolipoprotein diacylglycerol transferase
VHPLLFVLRVGDVALPIGSYGVMLCAAIALAAFGALRVARQERLDLGASIAAFGTAIAGGFCGGWLLHALVQTARLGSVERGFATPGLAVFGALLGGLAGLLLAGRSLRLPVLVLADLGVPWLACAQALGRLGCLLGGCCYGRAWSGPLALHYEDALAPAASAFGRHPWPLYEASALLFIAAMFGARPPAEPGSGRRALAYLALYSALRFALEPLRGDAVRGLFFSGAWSSSQLLALAVLVACAALAGKRPAGAHA